MSPVKLREATEWLVRLRDEAANAADRAAFEAWLAADPRHEEAYALAAGAVAGTASLGPDLRAHLATRPRPSALRANAPIAALAAAAVLALGLGLGYSLIAPRTYTTAVGEQRTIELADNSRVELNTGTRLSVAYSEEVRRIRIERGEALFNVAHDVERPFIVEARGQTVRAVGTQFVVRVDTASLSVVVVEGIVAVSDTSAPNVAPRTPTPRLVAGQKLDIGSSAPILAALPAEEIERNLAWRTGWLEFNGQPLSVAADEVARYTNARFVFEDAQVGQMRVWANFRASDLEGFLSSLEQNVSAVAVERNGRDVRLSRAPAADR